MFQISGDLHIFTAEDRPDFRDARYFFGEANAACALDATGHYRFHDGTHVFLRHRPRILIIAGIALAISNRLLLEIAFAYLVADRTIKRVIAAEELHTALPRLLDHWHACSDFLSFGRRRRAAALRLGG